MSMNNQGRLIDITENGILPRASINSSMPNFEKKRPIVPVLISSSNYQKVKLSEPSFKPASFKRPESIYKSTTINAIIGSHSSYPKENKNSDLLSDFNSDSNDDFDDKNEPISLINIKVSNQPTVSKPANPRFKILDNNNLNVVTTNKLKQNAT